MNASDLVSTPPYIKSLNGQVLFCYAVASLCACVPSDLHTEAVQAALAKYKERKMPMPSKRRSVLVQSSVEACTPPGETSVPGALCAEGGVYPANTHPSSSRTKGRLCVRSPASACRMLALSCVQWWKMMMLSFCCWREICRLMNVSILRDSKGAQFSLPYSQAQRPT